MSSIDGGWAEYQRLVLAELERYDKLIAKNGERIAKLELENEFLKRDLVAAKETDIRVRKLENDALTSGAVMKYRKWLIGGALLLITSVVIPLINLYLSK